LLLIVFWKLPKSETSESKSAEFEQNRIKVD